MGCYCLLSVQLMLYIEIQKLLYLCAVKDIISDMLNYTCHNKAVNFNELLWLKRPLPSSQRSRLHFDCWSIIKQRALGSVFSSKCAHCPAMKYRPVGLTWVSDTGPILHYDTNVDPVDDQPRTRLQTELSFTLE